ncbi:MAG: delta-class carbonic anhydrase [Ghiorsea sp.]
MKKSIIALAASALLATPAMANDHGKSHGGHGEAHGNPCAAGHHGPVANKVIAEQRHELAKNTKGEGFGPQSPRDIDAVAGNNHRAFNAAPAYTEMNLCNIHFHKNAEHKGGEFTSYAGNGNGHGYLSGYKYSGHLSASETAAVHHEICPSDHGALSVGDTIEVHYVHSTAKVKPGPTLGSCLSDAIGNPQLRVETQVYVVVNDKHALDFKKLTAHKKVNDLYQATGIPSNTGAAVQYEGSTTGPGYNEKGSPYQVSWSVRPQVAKVNIDTVGKWCEGNTFNEDHAHGVRNLVQNKDLLSNIK